MAHSSLVAEAFAQDYAKLLRMTEDLGLIREYLDHIRLCFISLTCLAYVMMVVHFFYVRCIKKSNNNAAAGFKYQDDGKGYDVENPSEPFGRGRKFATQQEWEFSMPQFHLPENSTAFPPPSTQVRSRHGSRDEETAIITGNPAEPEDDVPLLYRPQQPPSPYPRRQPFVQRLSTVEEVSDNNDDNHSLLAKIPDGNAMMDSMDTSTSYYTGTSGTSPQRSPIQSFHPTYATSM